MKRASVVMALLSLTLAGCGTDPTSQTHQNTYGAYDDISNLECRGNVLDAVGICEEQRARERLGAPEQMTPECRQILADWESGYYDERCGAMR